MCVAEDGLSGHSPIHIFLSFATSVIKCYYVIKEFEKHVHCDFIEATNKN